MRKLLVATSVVFLCGAANVALAGDLDLSGNHDLRSSAAAVVGWQSDLTLPTRALSANSAHIGVGADNGVITVGSHALSPHGTTRTVTGTDADLLLANSSASPGLATNLGASHSFSALPLPTESSRLLPLQ
jgi:hypothetical protein